MKNKYIIKAKVKKWKILKYQISKAFLIQELFIYLLVLNKKYFNGGISKPHMTKSHGDKILQKHCQIKIFF